MLGLDQDLLVVLIVAAFVFGSKRLPDIGKSLGQGIREFKKGISGQEEEKPPKPPEIEEKNTDIR